MTSSYNLYLRQTLHQSRIQKERIDGSYYTNQFETCPLTHEAHVVGDYLKLCVPVVKKKVKDRCLLVSLHDNRSSDKLKSVDKSSGRYSRGSKW